MVNTKNIFFKNESKSFYRPPKKAGGKDDQHTLTKAKEVQVEENAETETRST